MKPLMRNPGYDDSYAQCRNCAEQEGHVSRVGQLASQGCRCSKEGGCPRADDVGMKAESRDSAEDRYCEPGPLASSPSPQCIEPSPRQHRDGEGKEAHELLGESECRPERHDPVEDSIEAAPPPEREKKRQDSQEGQNAQVTALPGPQECQSCHGDPEVKALRPKIADVSSP